MDRRHSTRKTKVKQKCKWRSKKRWWAEGARQLGFAGGCAHLGEACGAGTQHSPSITPSCTPTPQTWRGREPPVGGELRVPEEQCRDRIPEQEAGAGWEESGNVPTSLQMWGGRWIPQCSWTGAVRSFFPFQSVQWPCSKRTGPLCAADHRMRPLL